MNMEPLENIQEWYAACCDGEWEHTYGVRIETLDNPGWAVDIDLTDTPLAGKPFESVNLERTENDWLNCQVSSGRFRGRGGPKNLDEILHIFRDWAA
jgi:hypothetical protein